MGTAALFYNPRGLALDSQGNLFVADYSNNMIRMVTTSGVVTTYSGGGGCMPVGLQDGPLGVAKFNYPYGIAIDTLGNLFIADSGNHAIRKLTPAGMA